ncbi:MAG: sigma-54-dependent transcriptional regulator [Anaerolineales bacterium]
MSFSILIVDDEENARSFIKTFLTSQGFEVFDAATLHKAKEHIESGEADIILLDVNLPDGYGPSLLEDMARLAVRPPIILITAYGDIEMAVDAMKNGAHDFLTKPLQLSQLEKSIRRAAETLAMRRELAHLRKAQYDTNDYIIGSSPAMVAVYDQAQRAAAASASVLITGETGTGKEVLAKAIRQMGPRAQKPFIPENCAAIQSNLLESELFGHEKGAFTGAEKRKPGLMEIADGGILFLDEIASMPIDMQAKLLRALEDRSFRRVGGENIIRVDVQVIAASNRDLKAMMLEGKFRDDLYYRLKVVDLHLPPLRERREDIPVLVGLFVRTLNLNMGQNITDVTPRAMQALIEHDWPGNIRELRNVIERALLFCDDASIDLAHLPGEIAHRADNCD